MNMENMMNRCLPIFAAAVGLALGGCVVHTAPGPAPAPVPPVATPEPEPPPPEPRPAAFVDIIGGYSSSNCHEASGLVENVSFTPGGFATAFTVQNCTLTLRRAHLEGGVALEVLHGGHVVVEDSTLIGSVMVRGDASVTFTRSVVRGMVSTDAHGRVHDAGENRWVDSSGAVQPSLRVCSPGVVC